MRRVIAGSVLFAALVGGLRVPGLPWWGLVLGLAVVGAFAWRLSTCPHDGPLALLPSTTDLDGTPLPPRWFCDQCGQTWAANFEKEQTPVRKFTGYDESKAVNAARRASELADRQRALALQRAGLRPAGSAAKKAKPAPQPALAADTADVVPIGQGRRFAG
jgi:hypothetical protein